MPPPADWFNGGFCVALLDENGTLPCRISSNDQYRIDRIKVARYITAVINVSNEMTTLIYSAIKYGLQVD